MPLLLAAFLVGATASSCDMEPQGQHYEGTREEGTGPDPTEGAITRPAGLSVGGHGAVMNPWVASGTLLILGIFMVS